MEVTVFDMAGQVFSVLTNTEANIQVLDDLKTMFTKFFTNTNRSSDGSSSVSISIMETEGGTLVPNVQTEDACIQQTSPSPEPGIWLESGYDEEQAAEGRVVTRTKAGRTLGRWPLGRQ